MPNPRKKKSGKRKLTAAERERKLRFQTIFINGKQKRVPRPLTIDGMDVDEFIRRNADPIWLQQNEMWEYIEVEPEVNRPFQPPPESDSSELPF